MSLPLIKKQFIKHGLAIATASIMASTAYAGTSEQQEVQQLRAEVAELRALIQQQAATQQQIVAEQKARPVVVAPAPVASSAITIDPKDLKVTTAKGAEVKMYGFIRGDANYIIKGADSDFNSVSSSTENAKDKLRATANVTRLGLDFSTPAGDSKVGGKVEVDFAGTNESLRIRHAYLTYNNWLFGQTTSNFLSSHAPEMIDFSTNIGGGTKRLPQVRYGYKFDQNTQLFVSAEEGDTSGVTGTTKYALPVLTAKVVHNFADGKGAASVRALAENYKSTETDDKTGWGVAIGANYQVAQPLKLFADFSHVKGNSIYLYGSNKGYAIDGSSLALNEFNTFQTGLTYQILPNLRSTLAYGGMYADDDNSFARLATSQNKEVSQAWINFIYTPVKPIDLGLEYVNGKRETFAGQKYDDDRIGLMARYNF